MLGQPFVVERIGTDGDARKMAALYQALDGRVDAFGLGGADLYVIAGDKKYVFNNVRKLVANARQTPVLDGSGLKNTLERDAIAQLDGLLGWRTQKVLMVSAVDRFGMAEALADHGADVVYGDLVFGLNVDRPLRSIGALRRVAGLVLPVLTKLPQDWFYPTGKKQEQSVEGKGTKYYAWADVIAGDTHYAKRYAPQNLSGKTILTQTITAADREWMKARGVRRLVTTTPRMGQRNFATNVLEAMFVALSGQRAALSGPAYLDYIRQVGFKPEVNEL
ncbi:quinate 5-dehydrogenase [Deinococcus sp. HMF7620]|uniref:Quinate 5-dehydrogenase n=1 Tax=Deinococcus arboris TaxID=2682977 RepID=A0A7C9HPL2_9DEIO|nr:quinate 5-dehydrogenase [Deinococcus arboris]